MSSELIKNVNENQKSERKCESNNIENKQGADGIRTSYNVQSHEGDSDITDDTANETTVSKMKSKADTNITNISNSFESSQESQNNPRPSTSRLDFEDSNTRWSNVSDEERLGSLDSNTKETVNGMRETNDKVSEKRGKEEDGDDDEEEATEKAGEEEGVEYRVPYYLENFVFILNTVIHDEFYSYLFNSEDREVISTFNNLSGR